MPTGLDTADAHRLPHRCARHALDLGPVIGHARQHDIAQRQLQGDESQPAREQQPAKCPQPGPDAAQGQQATHAGQPVIGRPPDRCGAARISQLSNHFARGGNSSLQSPN